MSKLHLFVDECGVICVGGRIRNALGFYYEKKHPILISGKHYFSKLLFQYQHKQMMHSGPQAFLYHLRESWWPIGGRDLARKVVNECIICKRIRGKTLLPIMGNLPEQRVTQSYPFERCGVDCAGPVFILQFSIRVEELKS